MYIERNESRNIYVYVLCFMSKVDKSKQSFFHLNQSLLCSVRSKSVTFWLLFGHASIWFEIFLFVAHLYKYLSSAVKTSRTNNTPFFDFSECSKTIDEKRAIQESIHYESYYCGEFIPPHNTTLELKLERVSSLGKNERKCYHHRIR